MTQYLPACSAVYYHSTFLVFISMCLHTCPILSNRFHSYELSRIVTLSVICYSTGRLLEQPHPIDIFVIGSVIWHSLADGTYKTELSVQWFDSSDPSIRVYSLDPYPSQIKSLLYMVSIFEKEILVACYLIVHKIQTIVWFFGTIKLSKSH